MHELMARLLAGVDPGSPGAIWQVYANALALVPWAALFWWNVAFGLVGALIGRWRGSWQRGLVWGLVLGPIGWLVSLLAAPKRRRAEPPPLPPAAGKGPHRGGV